LLLAAVLFDLLVACSAASDHPTPPALVSKNAANFFAAQHSSIYFVYFVIIVYTMGNSNKKDIDPKLLKSSTPLSWEEKYVKKLILEKRVGPYLWVSIDFPDTSHTIMAF
jgi:hypothetical protein